MAKKKWSDSDWTMLSKLNNTKVTQEELFDIFTEHAELHCKEDSIDTEDLMILIVSRHSRSTEKAKAIYFRLSALAQLIKTEGVLPGWTFLPKANGAVTVQSAVLSATALEPLARVGDDIGFDKNSFLDRVLILAKTEGFA